LRLLRRNFVMHGFYSSSEPERAPPTRWSSEWNFGLIAMIGLSTLAIAVAGLMPAINAP
jgi:hypothetical protein